MSPRKLVTAADAVGRRLDDYLAERLAGALDEVRALIRDGGVYVERRRTERADHALAAGQRIAIHAAPAAPAPAASADEPRIIHADADVVVVDKPTGLATTATRERSSATLARWIEARYPGATAAHRLDRGASGIVVFARTSIARQLLAAAFGSGAAERVYVAVVHGAPPPETRCELPIGPDPRDRRRMVAGVGRPARSRVRTRRRGSWGDAPTALVEVSIETGRTHQVRVHLAALGTPIVGDPIYGRADDVRLALHATRLAWPGAGPFASPPPPSFDPLCA
jgi:23S rRNA pseudouridine1911/1915/1917 synthase